MIAGKAIKIILIRLSRSLVVTEDLIGLDLPLEHSVGGKHFSKYFRRLVLIDARRIILKINF